MQYTSLEKYFWVDLTLKGHLRPALDLAVRLHHMPNCGMQARYDFLNSSLWILIIDIFPQIASWLLDDLADLPARLRGVVNQCWHSEESSCL